MNENKFYFDDDQKNIEENQVIQKNENDNFKNKNNLNDDQNTQEIIKEIQENSFNSNSNQKFQETKTDNINDINQNSENENVNSENENVNSENENVNSENENVNSENENSENENVNSENENSENENSKNTNQNSENENSENTNQNSENENSENTNQNLENENKFKDFKEKKQKFFNKKTNLVVDIKVIGVGGGGNNTIHSMVREGMKGAEFIVANTDAQVLKNSIADTIIPLGYSSSKGLGAGADPELGRKSALESEDLIKKIIKGADMVIIAAGMGGGTGTGGAPIIAKIAKNMGALTIGVVTTPFSFEGTKRIINAEKGLEQIKKYTDSLIVVSNDKLLQLFGSISLKDSFMYADKILKQTVRTITDLIAVPALINLDFADVVTIMKNKGPALIGIGRASGEDRAVKAAIHAISSPILEASIKGASDAIINISGGDITLEESSKSVETIKKAAGKDLNIIFGVSIIESLEKDIQVSVIATGLKKEYINKKLSEKELKEESSKTLESLDLNFDNQETQELLINDPLPQEEKFEIEDELNLQNSPFEISEEDEEDEDDLPSFLKR